MAASSFSCRLEQLAKSSRRSLWRGAIVAGLPLAGMLGGVGGFALIDRIETSAWWQSHFANAGNAAMWWGYGLFYLPLWLAALAAGIATAYVLMRRRFDSSYDVALSILQHTDVPVLIADGQILTKLAVEASHAEGIGIPDAIARRRGGEDQLKLAAAYLRKLQAISQSGQPTAAKQVGHLRRFLNPVRMTACGLGSILSALTLGCPFNFGLSCLLGPPLVIYAGGHGLPYAEYLGNLAAICDFMLAEPPDRPD